MGYFSNGTEGEAYYAKWCSRCIHERAMREGSDGPGCMVWGAHLLNNYEECNNKNSILHLLIPRNESGPGNGKCTMFVSGNEEYDPLHPDLFRPPMKEDA